MPASVSITAHRQPATAPSYQNPSSLSVKLLGASWFAAESLTGTFGFAPNAHATRARIALSSTPGWSSAASKQRSAAMQAGQVQHCAGGRATTPARTPCAPRCQLQLRTRHAWNPACAIQSAAGWGASSGSGSSSSSGSGSSRRNASCCASGSGSRCASVVQQDSASSSWRSSSGLDTNSSSGDDGGGGLAGRRAALLPAATALHQLWMSLHLGAHAAESVPPAALLLFREFLVRLSAAVSDRMSRGLHTRNARTQSLTRAAAAAARRSTSRRWVRGAAHCLC